MKLTATISRCSMLAAAITSASCANFPPQPLSWRPPPPFVTGTVFYREVQPLPANATVQVQLTEISAEGTPGTVVSTQTITDTCNFIDPPCNGPVFYQLAFDPAKLDSSREYHVSAQILAGDKPIFASDTPNRVLTRGYSQNAQVLVTKQP